MLRPSIFGENLFEDFFDFPDFEKMEQQMNKKLYGHHANNLMKTDVKEKEDAQQQEDLIKMNRKKKPADISVVKDMQVLVRDFSMLAQISSKKT